MKNNYFIHIPKNAGSSAVFSTDFKQPSHKKYLEIKDNIKEDDYLWSIVRNPYDRAISLYYFMKQLIEGRAPERIRSRHKIMKANDLNDYWVNYFSELDRDKLNYFFPQANYLVGSKGGISSRFDKLLRYENLESDWADLQRVIGVPNLVYRNKTTNKPNEPWENQLSDEAKVKIGDLYAKDFESLGYEKY